MDLLLAHVKPYRPVFVVATPAVASPAAVLLTHGCRSASVETGESAALRLSAHEMVKQGTRDLPLDINPGFNPDQDLAQELMGFDSTWPPPPALQNKPPKGPRSTIERQRVTLGLLRKSAGNTFLFVCLDLTHFRDSTQPNWRRFTQVDSRGLPLGLVAKTYLLHDDGASKGPPPIFEKIWP